MKAPRYRLTPGSKVREEDFGLLFYTMSGPHLYFLFSGKLLNSRFFQGEFTLDQWMQERTEQGSVSNTHVLELKKALNQLREKGVILER
jgi:putative mycofactocin binding protein MftB